MCSMKALAGLNADPPICRLLIDSIAGLPSTAGGFLIGQTGGADAGHREPRLALQFRQNAGVR